MSPGSMHPRVSGELANSMARSEPFHGSSPASGERVSLTGAILSENLSTLTYSFS